MWKHKQITASTSPWKSDSKNRVRRRKAFAQLGSKCSSTERKWERRYAISLLYSSVPLRRYQQKEGAVLTSALQVFSHIFPPASYLARKTYSAISFVVTSERKEQPYLIWNISLQNSRSIQLHSHSNQILDNRPRLQFITDCSERNNVAIKLTDSLHCSCICYAEIFAKGGGRRKEGEDAVEQIRKRDWCLCKTWFQNR